MKKPSNFDFVSKTLKDESKDSHHFVWEEVTIFNVVMTGGPFRVLRGAFAGHQCGRRRPWPEPGR